MTTSCVVFSLSVALFATVGEMLEVYKLPFLDMLKIIDCCCCFLLADVVFVFIYNFFFIPKLMAILNHTWFVLFRCATVLVRSIQTNANDYSPRAIPMDTFLKSSTRSPCTRKQTDRC